MSIPVQNTGKYVNLLKYFQLSCRCPHIIRFVNFIYTLINLTNKPSRWLSFGSVVLSLIEYLVRNDWGDPTFLFDKIVIWWLCHRYWWHKKKVINMKNGPLVSKHNLFLIHKALQIWGDLGLHSLQRTEATDLNYISWVCFVYWPWISVISDHFFFSLFCMLIGRRSWIYWHVHKENFRDKLFSSRNRLSSRTQTQLIIMNRKTFQVCKDID